MTAEATGWRLGGASVRGAAHIRRGQPNQDAIGWLPATADAEATDAFVAAIADGHGGAPHFRSDAGARLAIEAARTVLGRFLAAQGGDDPQAAVAEVVEAWRQAVMQDLTVNPLEDAWIEADEDKLLPYGATLAAVAVRPDRLMALQIGDGDMLFGYPDGRIERPLPSDQGLVGEQTYSLCLDGAATRFRTRILEQVNGSPWPDFIMLSTDGVAKSFADEAAFQSIARDYRAAVRKMGLRGVLDRLETWLSEVSRRGSGDDVTLCLAISTPPGAPDAGSEAAAQARETVW